MSLVVCTSLDCPSICLGRLRKALKTLLLWTEYSKDVTYFRFDGLTAKTPLVMTLAVSSIA